MLSRTFLHPVSLVRPRATQLDTIHRHEYIIVARGADTRTNTRHQHQRINHANTSALLHTRLSSSQAQWPRADYKLRPSQPHADSGTTHRCSYRVQGGMSFAKATCERENKWEGDSQYRLGATYGSVPQAHRKYGIKNKTKQKHYCTDSTRCLLLAIIPFPLSFPYTDPERTTLICLLTSDSLFTTCLTTWFWYNVIT
jgi:hypothetical protein